MKESTRDIFFTATILFGTAWLFFTLGVSAAALFGVNKTRTMTVEYKEIAAPSANDTTGSDDAKKVDLNSATVEDLMQIEGIGESYAKRIIAYREEIGGYTFLEQLLDVDGVGEKKYSKWLPYLTIEGATTTTTSQSSKVNLNTATKEQLMTISGIGEKTAESILAYREEIGAFTSLEQLLEVSGIGEKKLESWRDSLTLGDE